MLTNKELMQRLIDALDKNDNYAQVMTLQDIRVALAQPEKKWVGLVVADMRELGLNAIHFDMAKAIAARLKEKNT
jgi:hypothetical protein